MNTENAGVWGAEEIADNGERVSHLNKDWTFYGHLSIYDFATQFCKDANVLDVGSGAGYGTALLADSGARYVIGFDASEKAVAFSKYHFHRSNLEFREMHAEKMHDLSLNHFDFILACNILEHVEDVSSFFRTVCSLLKPTGTLMIAVPPITDDRLLYLNAQNPYHLNLWYPRQWYSILDRFFSDITPYLHGVRGISSFLRPEHMNTGSTLTEKSFGFAPATVDDMYSNDTVTAIFVVRGPRTKSTQPSKGDQLEFVDEPFNKVSHLNKDWTFYGHLSIYDFATQFCKDANVLDVGSGTGYGTAHLADSGVRYVIGIDSDVKAVKFSKYHFHRSNLEFREMSAEKMHDLPLNHFDFILACNSMIQVADIPGFLRIVWSLLKPTGTLLITVPPITDDQLLYLNIQNPYHLNLWSPRQWYSVLDRFFSDITPCVHGVEKIGAFFRPEHLTTGSTLTEKSFVFAPTTVDDMYRMFTLTAIFHVRGPRTESTLPSKDDQLEFVDESFTRPPGYIDPEVLKRLQKYLG